MTSANENKHNPLPEDDERLSASQLKIKKNRTWREKLNLGQYYVGPKAKSTYGPAKNLTKEQAERFYHYGFSSNKRIYRPFSNKSILLKMRKENKITPGVEKTLNSMALEEVIAVKLELIIRNCNNKLYGFPLYTHIVDITKEALVRTAFSVSRNLQEATAFLGIKNSYFEKVKREQNIYSAKYSLSVPMHMRGREVGKNESIEKIHHK